MTLLSVTNLGKYFGAELIFSDLTFQVARGEKVAIVGVNGAGKSTLLKIIAGLIPNDDGHVHVVRGNRVAYLAQESYTFSDRTLWQEMETAFDHVRELQHEMRRLEERLTDTSIPDWDDTMQRYGDITARFEHAGGYHIEQHIEYTLQNLGFSETHYHQPVMQLSGGQKTRAALAATLLSAPDILLLDEPTNHLDLGALEWLDNFLKTWDGTLITVSHDRYFLDKSTQRTIEIIHGRIEDYPAPYQRYLDLKAERLEQQLKAYEAQQEFIAKTEEFIRRYKAGQRSKEAKGREKRLNRYKEQEALDRPMQQQTMRMKIETRLRSGDMVLACRQLAIGYDNTQATNGDSHEHVLMYADKLEIQRGERVAIIGPNGCGKTTFLRTLVGELPMLTGKFQVGHNVKVGYYAQGHESLDMQATVLQELLRINPAIGEQQARTLLGRFLFSGDDVFKQVGTLSGGERNRVALAQLTLKPGNLLVMDEPTNHLDISSREALEEVLAGYTGSILFVSHDRFFIDAIADKLWVFQDGKLVEFLGSYSDYQSVHAKVREQTAKKQTREKDRTTTNNRKESNQQKQRQRHIDSLEKELHRLEQELAQVKEALDIASNNQDVTQITSLGEQYVALEAQLEECYEQWAELAEG